ncbi:MAG: pimeloyl-ACP methyl ester carboxylesterase [Candidatus Woesearchaeota archaeon]|jgi:pimeloyl-ACP methyl ester carboxylesterase
MGTDFKRIIIKNNSDENLIGDYYDRNTEHVVLIVHGSRCSRKSSPGSQITRKLKESISVYAFDLSGNGESQGELEDATYSKEVEDIHTVVTYFQKIGKKVILIGHSKGATETIIYLKKYPNTILTYILLAPRIELKKSQEYVKYQDHKEDVESQGYFMYNPTQKVTKEFLKDIEQYDDLTKYKEKIETKGMLIHGVADEIIHITQADHFAPNANIILKKIPEANHSFTEHIDEVIKLIEVCFLNF